jgi:hypothetical protein
MVGHERPGTIYWIDHYLVNTNDSVRWEAFHAQVLGATAWPDPNGKAVKRGFFQDITSNGNGGRGTNHGGFVCPFPLPPSQGLGRGLPRYGFYIEARDIEAHLGRLDAAGAVHGAPQRTESEGEPGTTIYWQDPDANQYEFWAPDVLPPGAMTGCTPVRVGRISHGIFESRDLARTAAFFSRYCALEPYAGPHVDADTLVLPLGAGGRLVFKQVDELAGRTTGCGLRDAHTALIVRREDFIPNLERMWAELPEWDYDPGKIRTIANPGALPARTVLHISPSGRKFKEMTGRGDDWLDWDTNMFHFQGGSPLAGSMSDYENHPVEEYFDEWAVRA